MDPNPKNYERAGIETNGADTLSAMPSFDEHMKSMEQEAPLDKKYYEQAAAKKNEWIELANKDLEKAKALKIEDVQALTNIEEVFEKGTEPSYRALNTGETSDLAIFNEFKEDQIESAENRIKMYGERDLDTLAKYCRNQEMIDQIFDKFKKGEKFSSEELDYLGDVPESPYDHFDATRFHSIDIDDEIVRHGSIVPVPVTYEDFLGGIRENWTGTRWEAVAHIQLDRMMKRDGALLLKNEDVQKSLDSIDARREGNPFFGETNLNRSTGEERTYTTEDNYPRLENESDAAYTNRLKRIGLKTRIFQMKQK